MKKIILLSFILIVIGGGIVGYRFKNNLWEPSDFSSFSYQMSNILKKDQKAEKITPFALKNMIHQTYLVAGGDIMLSRNIGYLNKTQGYDRIFKEGNFHPISQFP